MSRPVPPDRVASDPVPPDPVPAWVRACGLLAIAAALPTIVWRVVVGFGAELGTPASWRLREGLPGPGTAYVLGLSMVQLAAALLTLVLVWPGADRIPRRLPGLGGRRLPTPAVVLPALAGGAVLIVICVLSMINWRAVDPFGDATAITGWTWLCWACYLVAPLWPLLLIATTVGYARSRARQATSETVSRP